MILTDDSPGNPPPSEAGFQRELKARRVQQVAGLLPGDAWSGYMTFDLCHDCGAVICRDVPLAVGRGDELRTDCQNCSVPQTHTLDDEFPLAPIGSDAAPVDGSDGAR